jgi:hypothetical protein
VSDDLTVFGPISLGGLIDRLKKCPPEREVMFDWCGMGPVNFGSYRGYYDHLALSYEDGARITAGDLLELAEAEVGATHSGWKGGTFRMDRNTPVWVANSGDCWGTGIVDVDSGGEDGWRVVLLTKKCD